MGRRTDWCSCASRCAQIAYGLLTTLLLGAAAHGQDDSADIGFADQIDSGYAEDSDQHLLVSYRPSCRHCAPNCCTCVPGYAAGEMPQDYAESPSDEAQPMDITPQIAPPTPAQFGGVSGETYVAMAQNATGGYLDSAIVWSQVRFRFDAGYDNDTPDRAEFFYAKCGCFGPGSGAEGPPKPETSVDYQDIRLYAENAFNDRFSVFGELPIRFLNPVMNNNTAGLGDMNAGVKYALIASPTRYFTFQFRTYIPTGDSDRGLGTNHVSVEPGLLLWQRYGRVRLEGELAHWISVDGSDFAGNVLRYGGGIGYDLFADYRNNTRLTPIMEWVGWTVLDGGKLDLGQQGGVADASGETIVNFKLGARYVSGADSIYGGWGHAVTGDVWYQDILRLEYRRVF
ncbi:MAG: hypothetical protein HY000_23615 [Planctomycetes bacterium]|nr:hypothetical protein [Planctomycetota bacterium]